MRFLFLPLRFLLLLFHTYISRETGLALLAKKRGIKVCILVNSLELLSSFGLSLLLRKTFFLPLILPLLFPGIERHKARWHRSKGMRGRIPMRQQGSSYPEIPVR